MLNSIGKKSTKMLKIEQIHDAQIEELLYQWYHVEKKGITQISKEYGVSKPTIIRWLKRAEIQIRTQSEILQSEEYRRKCSEAMKRNWQDEEYKRKRSEALQSEEVRRKRSETMKRKWQDEEYKRKHGKALQSEEIRRKRIEILQSEEYRRKCSEAMKRKWQDKEYAQKVLSQCGRAPNNLEIFVNTLFPLNVLYVGDGSWWRYLPTLGKYKNPDFKITGKNKVIEIYGDYWHRNEDAQVLINAYSESNIDCLVLWENEIYTDLQSVLMQIATFIGLTNWQLSLPYVL